MKIEIPDYCLVLLVGATGSGKSSFAAKHFAPTEVVSSDWARAAVADAETDQSATKDAFELVELLVAKRLARRRLTVVDATNVRSRDRQRFVALAKRFHAHTVALVLNMPAALCLERNRARPGRNFGDHVVRRQVDGLRNSTKRLHKDGIRFVHAFDGVAQVDAAQVVRTPLWVDRRQDSGPFDIIGDVHGCADELEALLAKLGYDVARTGEDYHVTPPHGRRAVFVGDLVDRGPRVPDVLKLVMHMVESGAALCVLGNHETKLVRYLRDGKGKLNHGLEESVAQLADAPKAFVDKAIAFMDGLISHYWLDDGKLVVAHAGLKEEMHGRSSGAARAFALYGETTGELDGFGLPVRQDWARDYRGKAKVVHGHVPVSEAVWNNGTLDIDTGCVFGGRLTALRYPELDLVSVPAARAYVDPIRPLSSPN